MTTEGTSIVYIRRRPEDRLDGIINLAEQHYASGLADFLIVDLSGDTGALTALGRRGDPVRYLAIAAFSQVEYLLACRHAIADVARIVVVDDAPPPDWRALPSQQRMEFVSRYDFAPSAASAV
jgi:hypothetical protein